MLYKVCNGIAMGVGWQPPEHGFPMPHPISLLFSIVCGVELCAAADNIEIGGTGGSKESS